MKKKNKNAKSQPELAPVKNPGAIPPAAVSASHTVTGALAFPGLTMLQLSGKDAEDFQKIVPGNEVSTLKVVKAAQAVIAATVDLAGRYRELVQTIRDTKTGILETRLILKGLGFHKVRVSEIQRVAFSSDEVFSSYIAGNIGLKGALELVRNGITTPAACALLPEVSSTGEKAADVIKRSGSSAEVSKLLNAELDEQAAATPAAKKKSVQWAKRAEKAAAALLKIAAMGKCRAREWSVPGWTVTLVENDIEPEIQEGEE